MLDDLTKKLQALQAPDREVDLLIMRHVMNIGGPAETAMPYTTSIDAALTLVPDTWTAWELRSRANRTHFSCDLSRLSECDSSDEDWVYGRGPTAAIAVCVAALKALKGTPND